MLFFLLMTAFGSLPWKAFFIVSGAISFSVVIHYLTVFGVPGIKVMDEDWEQFEMEKEIRKLKSKKEFEQYLIERESEQLELKQLEKRYNADDLV